MVLLKMKETAESYVDANINNAVVAVPAYSNDSQRHANKDAGNISGMNGLRIINEPRPHCRDRSRPGQGHPLRRGGTFDVPPDRRGGYLRSQSHGWQHLQGGEDLDTRSIVYFTQKSKRKNVKDVSYNLHTLRRMRTACEFAKDALFSAAQASVEINTLLEYVDLYIYLAHAHFNKLSQGLFPVATTTLCTPSPP
ncbi:heat shock protein 70 [Mycena galericulata]|nr:heat shock protein 70 [Mycena galericulata]